MKNFFKWVQIGAGIFVSLLVIGLCTYFALKARESTDPWLWWDSSTLYTNAGETLTAAKRNALVAKKWLTDLKLITCTYYSSNAWVVWWKSNTWTTTNCGWTYKPSDFTNCLSAARLTDWNWVQRWLHRCRKAKWDIYLDTASSEVSLGCNYLCRN